MFRRKFLQLPIEDIKIKKRIRKDLGDLTSLIDSLRKHGLMNPVVINKNNELIAGHRRIESAKVLGWKSIDVLVLDKISELEKLELEIEENVVRKDFSDDELEDAGARLAALKNPGIFKRILNAIIRVINSLFGLEEK
jgi:ParB family chromosome partitioning protein